MRWRGWNFNRDPLGLGCALFWGRDGLQERLYGFEDWGGVSVKWNALMGFGTDV